MIIKPSAVRAFLHRKRADFRHYKKLSVDRLDAMMEDLPVRPPIWDKLRAQPQRACFILGARYRRFFFICDTGTGKSLLAIALGRYFRKRKIIRRMLVLTRNKINKDEWESELLKHSPNSSYVVLRGSSEEKWKDLTSTDTLFVFETYAGLLRMVCDLKKPKKKTKKGKLRLVPNPIKVEQLLEEINGLVLDESKNAGNHEKLPFRICRRLARDCEVVFPMTGTPFNRDPEPLWPQMFLVDDGYSLGETLGLFRAAFYKSKRGYWTMFEHKFDRTKRALLNDCLAHRSIEYEADAATLPKVVPILKAVSLPMDAEVYYQRAKQALIDARGNYRETKNVFLRMRQISSGFVGYQDDETGEKAKMEFPECPKLEMLLSVCEDIRPEYPVIIYFDFNYSGERIVRELRELGLKADILYGKTKDAKGIRDRFNSGKLQFICLQNAMGYGLNIQVAKYGLYYEAPVSAVDRKQTRRRLERQYSAHKSVFLYDFVTKGTMDERILEFHKRGEDLFQAVVRGRVR